MDSGLSVLKDLFFSVLALLGFELHKLALSHDFGARSMFGFFCWNAQFCSLVIHYRASVD